MTLSRIVSLSSIGLFSGSNSFLPIHFGGEAASYNLAPIIRTEVILGRPLRAWEEIVLRKQLDGLGSLAI